MLDGSAQVWYGDFQACSGRTGNNASRSCIGRVREGRAGKRLSA